ncbi:hypothetical protein CH373_15960 [Leptospira perolatii]|uniref:Uncharacterized protein n=1 Tax=Leptospira perolatii TaxID=2023191 RepID=A0A2M9ZJ49_9LEPT|nr:hypothetical protein [Leptospira perolatii]PJZ68195.1 hypothetical protein CH360_17530 [Leptospira perolatii]PJZ72090.1 hypothetical protein CH373_15960 [Leptospira perolatii]
MNLRLFGISFLLLVCHSLSSYPHRDARGEVSENYMRQQGIVNVELPKMQFSENEPIKIEVTVRNTGNEALRIFPATQSNELYKSFQVIVRDEDGRTVTRTEGEPKQDPVRVRRNRIQNHVGDDVKEIILHTNETFKKEIRLDQLYEFEPGKKYFITAYFYPNISEYSDHFVRSENHPYFTIEEQRKQWVLPGVPHQDPVVDGLEPEEVIHLLLGAEKKGNWKLNFKWIHFPEYVQSYDRFAKDYNDSEEGEKDFILEEFRRFLTQNRSGVLQYYKILGVEKIHSNLSKVRVAIERQINKVPVRYEYIYTLKRVPEEDGSFWKVASLIAKVRK